MKRLSAFLLLLISLKGVAQDVYPLVPYRIGHHWGYCDTLGRVQIQPAYSEVELFSAVPGLQVQIAKVFMGNKQGVINSKGQLLVPAMYASVNTEKVFRELLFVVTNAQGLQGIYGNGRELLPCAYNEIHPEGNHSFLLTKGERKGLMNGKGKMILSISHGDIYPVLSQREHKVVWEARTGDKTVRVTDDRVENELPPYPEIMLLDEESIDSVPNLRAHHVDHIRSFDGDMVYVLQKSGRNAIYVAEPHDTAALVWLDATYEILDAVYCPPPSFARKNYGARALLVAKKDGRFGLINDRGRIVLPFNMDSISIGTGKSHFDLQRNGLHGMFLPESPYNPVPPQFEEVSYARALPVGEGWTFIIFRVRSNGKEGYVGENGVRYFRD